MSKKKPNIITPFNDRQRIKDLVNEVIDDIIVLKSKKVSDPKNSDFDNRVRLIIGKNLDENEMKGK